MFHRDRELQGDRCGSLSLGFALWQVWIYANYDELDLSGSCDPLPIFCLSPKSPIPPSASPNLLLFLLGHSSFQLLCSLFLTGPFLWTPTLRGWCCSHLSKFLWSELIYQLICVDCGKAITLFWRTYNENVKIMRINKKNLINVKIEIGIY